MTPTKVINRTSRPLSYIADGRVYTLQPGVNIIPSTHVRFAKSQNPVMGSEDYYTLSFDSLIGVDGKDDCSPIPDELLESAIERFDRSSMSAESRKVAVVEARYQIKTRAQVESLTSPDTVVAGH
jgi:hypothetical protein